jgi:DNA-binding transcriptional MerR regulator
VNEPKTDAAAPKYGTNTFLRLVKISAPVMRGLEAAGVITPAKSDKGWRMFSEADRQAVAQWKAAQRRR